MSYARFGEYSNVYIYDSAQGITCCGCILNNQFDVETPRQMIIHLLDHVEAGHIVDEFTFVALLDEFRTQSTKNVNVRGKNDD